MESLPGYEYKVLPPVDLVVHVADDQQGQRHRVEQGVAGQRPGSQVDQLQETIAATSHRTGCHRSAARRQG